MIGARSSRYIVASCLAASHQSWRARSQQTAGQQIRKLPISHPILTSSPITAALQNCESSASRLAVPSRLQRSLSRVEQSSHVLSTHPRNDYQSLRWPSSFTQRVYSKKRNNCNSPRVLGIHWVHTLGHLESTTLPARVAARSV